jgi:hypothetical protein
MLPVSLGCPFFIGSSIFSNVYSIYFKVGCLTGLTVYMLKKTTSKNLKLKECEN